MKDVVNGCAGAPLPNALSGPLWSKPCGACPPLQQQTAEVSAGVVLEIVRGMMQIFLTAATIRPRHPQSKTRKLVVTVAAEPVKTGGEVSGPIFGA
jgi:hypothetical protein